jgi:predicted nucleic acid-binding protein
MGDRLLIDTDVVVDYLRGQAQAVAYLEGRAETLLVSSITVAELYAGVREGKERTALSTFLSAFETVVVDAAIAERGGLFRRDYGKSHSTGLADALIAATAVVAQAQLVTLNAKHFPMLSDVHVPYPGRAVEDRLAVEGIGLAPLPVGFDVVGRQQAHLEAARDQHAGPVVRTAARLHDHPAGLTQVPEALELAAR